MTSGIVLSSENSIRHDRLQFWIHRGSIVFAVPWWLQWGTVSIRTRLSSWINPTNFFRPQFQGSWMEMIQITNHQIFKLIICRISYEIKAMLTDNRYNECKYVLVPHNWYESSLFDLLLSHVAFGPRVIHSTQFMFIHFIFTWRRTITLSNLKRTLKAKHNSIHELTVKADSIQGP